MTVERSVLEHDESRLALFFRLLMVAIYLLAGIIHLRTPAPFLAITPDWVPFHGPVVALTGVAEIAGAIGLLTRRFRYSAGIGLALYALCVWPANFNHAFNDIAVGGQHMTWRYHTPRLLLQPVIIWWALYVGGVTRWPFRRAS
jgi:uncharacterized membrane protein